MPFSGGWGCRKGKDLHLGDDAACGPSELHGLGKLMIAICLSHQRIKRSMQTQQQSLVAGNSRKTPGWIVNESGKRHWPKAEKKESLNHGQRPWLEGRLGR